MHRHHGVHTLVLCMARLYSFSGVMMVGDTLTIALNSLCRNLSQLQYCHYLAILSTWWRTRNSVT